VQILGEAAVVIAGLCLAALGILFLSARRLHTTIDAEGVRTSSMFGRRSCRWSEVTDVDTDIDATDGNPVVWSIKIHRRSIVACWQARAARSFPVPGHLGSQPGDGAEQHDLCRL